MRIIPANTGRMDRSSFSSQISWDHPREYGENEVQQSFCEASAGSSPRIRGEWVMGIMRYPPAGIIPANTGRIMNRSATSIARMDHPREYGENSKPVARTAVSPGSSPRIRGEYLLTLENPTSRTDFTSLSFSTSSSAHAGGFGPSSFHGSSSRGYWMPHQCESFHVGGFPLATMHSHNKTLLVFICWVCHNRAP